MIKKTNILIPKIRFPEFLNDGNWNIKELLETTDKKIKWSFTGGPFGSNLKTSDYTTNGIRIIQLQNIGDGEFIDNYKIYTSIEKANELLSCNIYSGDIILSKMGNPVGRACIIPPNLERCVMASDGIRLAVDEKKYSKYFIYSLINSKEVREAIDKKATGSTRKRIGLDQLKKISLTIPKSLDEQQKIASCLSSLDTLITAHTQKLEVLKDHKKGLMQNLFPQEDETVPKYRFPEFENDEDWVKSKLGGIGEPLMCKRILKEQTNSKNGIPFYKIGTFGKEADSYIPVELYVEFKNKFSFPKIGDILISASGTIGRLVVYDGSPAYFQDSNIVWLGNDEALVLNSFLFHCYSKIKWQTSDGGIISRLYNSDLKNMSINFPKNKREQQKIALFLTTINDLINAQAEKIEKLQLHKKGLMQGLFPKIND